MKSLLIIVLVLTTKTAASEGKKNALAQLLEKYRGLEVEKFSTALFQIKDVIGRRGEIIKVVVSSPKKLSIYTRHTAPILEINAQGRVFTFIHKNEKWLLEGKNIWFKNEKPQKGSVRNALNNFELAPNGFTAPEMSVAIKSIKPFLQYGSILKLESESKNLIKLYTRGVHHLRIKHAIGRIFTFVFIDSKWTLQSENIWEDERTSTLND